MKKFKLIKRYNDYCDKLKNINTLYEEYLISDEDFDKKFIEYKHKKEEVYSILKDVYHLGKEEKLWLTDKR